MLHFLNSALGEVDFEYNTEYFLRDFERMRHHLGVSSMYGMLLNRTINEIQPITITCRPTSEIILCKPTVNIY